MKPVTELVVDAYGCGIDLNDPKRLETVAREAVESVGAKVAQSIYHQFQPHGLTLSLILMESHLVISTWPEYQMAITNIFLCNDQMDPKECWAHLEKNIRPMSTTFHEVKHQIGTKQPPLKKAV